MTRDAAFTSPQSAELDAARGTVRDAVAAVRNLWELLKSVRVGPKALRAVIPDVLAACHPMLEALEKLLVQLTPEAAAACAEQLRRLTVSRVQDLERALVRDLRGPFKAAERLALERSVVDVLHDLDVGLLLMELLMQARQSGRSVVLDAAEMAREAASLLDASSPSFLHVPVSLSAPSEPVNVAVDARVAMSLLALLIGLVATDSSRPVRITIEREGDGGCCLRLTTHAGVSEMTFTAPPPMEATRYCASTLCSTLGIRFESEADSVTLRFPPTTRP